MITRNVPRPEKNADSFRFSTHLLYEHNPQNIRKNKLYMRCPLKTNISKQQSYSDRYRARSDSYSLSSLKVMWQACESLQQTGKAK